LVENVEHVLLSFGGTGVDDALVVPEQGAAHLAEVDQVQQSVSAITTSALAVAMTTLETRTFSPVAVEGVETGVHVCSEYRSLRIHRRQAPSQSPRQPKTCFLCPASSDETRATRAFHCCRFSHADTQTMKAHAPRTKVSLAKMAPFFKLLRCQTGTLVFTAILSKFRAILCLFIVETRRVTSFLAERLLFAAVLVIKSA